MAGMLQGRLNHDLSHVRVHADRSAAESARAMGARAYTVGRDVVFGAGEYQPGTRAGRWLLAHELAHVVQQGGRSGPAPTAATAPVPAAEREAASVADAVAAGRGAPSIRQRLPTPAVQKQDIDAGTEAPATPEPAPAPMQGGLPAWSPNMLAVVLTGDKTRTYDGTAARNSCLGEAWPGRQKSLSDYGRFAHFCTTPASYPFEVAFYVDVMGIARPGAFRPPAVDVAWTFVADDQAGTTQSRRERDPEPRYIGEGHPLQPSFGRAFRVTSDSSGRLSITLGLTDADSGTSATYRDDIECNLVPCT